ncbi:hypothetical protein HPB49_026689 [Dermacentor silvarum]|nr:hypothetical protein HPB49_026689 [Dermacentor silvarum]
MTVVGERLQSSERWRDVELPQWWGSSKVLLTVPLTEGAAFYNLSLHGLWHPWQAYRLTLQSKICRTGTEGDGLVRFLVPWGSEDLFFHIQYPVYAGTGHIDVVKHSCHSQVITCTWKRTKLQYQRR